LDKTKVMMTPVFSLLVWVSIPSMLCAFLSPPLSPHMSVLTSKYGGKMFESCTLNTMRRPKKPSFNDKLWYSRSNNQKLVSSRENNMPFHLQCLEDLNEDAIETEYDSKGNEAKQGRIDSILSTLTSCFPLFVFSSAVLGIKIPSLLQWVSVSKSLIPLMLSLVMFGTGMTLEKSDFSQVLKSYPSSIPLGVLCQFIIMPLSAFLIGTSLLLNSSTLNGPSLYLGLVLVGCSPGGTASNLVALIAKADVALSVLLTACSTILASAVTPLLVKLIIGNTFKINGMSLCTATTRVVLLPVSLGMILNQKAPALCKAISRFTPFASVLLVSLICGGVVAQNSNMAAITSHTLRSIFTSVLLLHSVGFLVGYTIPKLFNFSEKTGRTISIETGMQNSALAVVLARSIGADPLASLPGAISATMHSCIGSILAAYWRWVDIRKSNKS